MPYQYSPKERVHFRSNPKNAKELQWCSYISSHGNWQRCWTAPGEISALDLDDDGALVVVVYGKKPRPELYRSSGVRAFNKMHLSSGERLFRAYLI